MNRRIGFGILVLSLLVVGAHWTRCDADDGDKTCKRPKIKKLKPKKGSPSDVITIKGNRFGTTEGTVEFHDGVAATVVSWSNKQIEVEVPAGAETGKVYVTSLCGKQSKGKKFKVVGASGYDIDLTLTGMTPSQEAIFQQAAARWEAIITGDVPDGVVEGQAIDDVLIDASAVPIDGPGGILGQAGPTWLRGDSKLPIAGMMQFDIDDLAMLESGGQLDEVILHEMGHVLGFGTIWQLLGLLGGSTGPNPKFKGKSAKAEYEAIFGAKGRVPVEATGGPGTALSHWRESVFDNELMTGWLDGGVDNPLSRITVGSMEDLGYEVDLDQADAYTPPPKGAKARQKQIIGRLEILDIEPQILPMD